MALRGMILGNKAVVKESGGQYYLARAPPWTDAPGKVPPAVRKVNDAFASAAKGCSPQNKHKHGTAFGVSEYNKCIGKKLRQVR